MGRRYAISDIHGCSETLKALVEEVLQVKDKDKLYFLGDFINKGPDTKGVLDYLFELKGRGIHIITLIGNHEVVFLKALANPEKLELFYIMGGGNMLNSFEVNSIEQIPERYVEFLRDLELYSKTEDYLLVHAGFNFQETDIFSDFEALVGINEMQVDPGKTNYRTVVHGHFPTKLSVISEQLKRKDFFEICIDNGCVYKYEDGLGNLIALDLDLRKLFIQECIDFIEPWKK